MLLEITTTHRPAGDLGYLLHKHPDRLQTFPLAFGAAHVYYPECTQERCTAALLLEVDPVGLVRSKGGERSLDQYVNDRPYVASSMLSVAISQVFGTALSGTCKTRPELVGRPIPLTATIACVVCKSGESMLRRLFEPLGYELGVVGHPLDPTRPEWGDSCAYSITLRSVRPLSELLSHLYVLVPVLDNDKHYWVGDDEVAKLLRHGEGWLAGHPDRDLIATRYLKYRRSLADDAIRQLREQDGESESAVEADTPDDPREESGERRLSLHEQRHGIVLSVLRARGCKRVVDLGCGEGRLLRELIKDSWFERVVGVDVSHRSLEIAAERLRLDRLPPTVRQRIELMHGSLLYRDQRIAGFDAAVLCEVIEHLDEPRLAAMERAVFECARPTTVIVTTPNSEHNVMWDSLSAGSMRHKDHRFEWTRDQFRVWADRLRDRFGYACEFREIGDPGVSSDGVEVGSPTQMGVFTRVD